MVGLVSEYPNIGTALTHPWDGARALHCANDAYRVIWQVDDDRAAVVVLLVGKKKRRSRTIYDAPRPVWPPG